MCPLRLILIFLSATLAGFLVIRNLKSPRQQLSDDVLLDSDDITDTTNNPTTQQSSCSKIRVALESGFWTFVDMASGKYLWRYLGSSSKRSL